MNIKQTGLILVVIALLTLVVGGASAQDTDQPQPQPFVQRPGLDIARELIQIVADETGMETTDIVTALIDRPTLADIITANGGDVEAVIASAVEVATERINTAVADGQMTQERADQILANLEATITDAINGDLRPNRPGNNDNRPGLGNRPGNNGNRPGNNGGRPGLGNRPGNNDHPLLDAVQGVVDSVLEQTGLTRQELRDQLRDGTPLADILTANGVDPVVFVDDLVAKAQTRLDTAVENGRITQERADELLTNLRDRLTDRINNPLPLMPDPSAPAI